jgi:nucleoside-triphosphatase THEP1
MINFDLKGNNIKQTIFIITGKIGSGKTTFLKKLISGLQEHSLSVSGFLAMKSSIKKSGWNYNLSFIDTGESIPLLSGEQVQGWIKTGNFYFNPEAIDRGNRILNDAQIFRKDLVVVDEIGIFELEGKIWSDSISLLVKKPVNIMIWVVRDTLVEKVIKKWGIKDPVITDIEKESVRQAEKRILARF